MEYFNLDMALQEAEADYNSAETQAIACGMLAVNISADKIAWVKMIFGEIDTSDSAHATKQGVAIELSGELFDLSKKQMQDSNLGFDILLPEEDEGLFVRVNALQQWCSGFVVGVTMAGVKDTSKLPEDSRELLADLTEIGTSGEFDLGDEDESEDAFEEIKEYIRMGVLLINEELQPIKQSTVVH